MDHSNGTVTYHFNPTAKHSLVRKHVVQRIQTAKQHSHNLKSTPSLSLKPIRTSALSSGGLPSPPVEFDHPHFPDFSANNENDLVVSPTPTPTEEVLKDCGFTSELVAHALQKLSNKQASLTDEDSNSGSASSKEDEQDSDIELLDEQHIRQKIADLTAEKHRLFQLMKSKIQEPVHEESSSPSCPANASSSRSSSENEKENSLTERPMDRPSQTPSSKPTYPSPSSSTRPPMYRSRPLSDRGYHHHIHAPPPPRSMYGPFHRDRRIGYSPRSPPPPHMRPSPYGPPPGVYRRRATLDRWPRY
ncbi:hypothetical protein Unana1_06873 [Umbelopsis nana]